MVPKTLTFPPRHLIAAPGKMIAPPGDLICATTALITPPWLRIMAPWSLITRLPLKMLETTTYNAEPQTTQSLFFQKSATGSAAASLSWVQSNAAEASRSQKRFCELRGSALIVVIPASG